MSMSLAQELNTVTLFDRLGGSSVFRRIDEVAIVSLMVNPVIR